MGGQLRPSSRSLSTSAASIRFRGLAICCRFQPAGPAVSGMAAPWWAPEVEALGLRSGRPPRDAEHPQVKRYAAGFVVASSTGTSRTTGAGTMCWNVESPLMRPSASQRRR